MENEGNEGLNLLADVALDGGPMGRNGNETELEVKWILEHEQSFVVKEMREMKKNEKLEKSYLVRWFCSSHPSYNLYEPNEHNTSIESEGAMKAVRKIHYKLNVNKYSKFRMPRGCCAAFWRRRTRRWLGR